MTTTLSHPGMIPTAETHAVRILVSLYAVEAAAFLIVVGIYKVPIYEKSLLLTKAGTVLLIAGSASLVFSGWTFAKQIVLSGRSRGKALAFGMVANLLSILMIFLLLEAIALMVARKTPEGITIGRVLVRPTWPELVAQSRGVVTGIKPLRSWETSYLVYDRELGWTVGPNRQTRDGLYFSSIEGIRSAGPNVRMADKKPPFRVALIGDSNAFSLEVPFQESWGYYLQRFLGDDVQVLNFGVDGYGIDQMYLRYQRDVRPWHSEVVVVGFIQHDLTRTMAVYPFVSLGWPGFLVKPRFVLENGNLRLLNVPLPTPEDILSTSQIHSLPYVEWDLEYASTDWSWRFDHGPLLLRFLGSAFPRGRFADPRAISAQAKKALNARLFAELVKAIEQDHASVLLVDMTRREADQADARDMLPRAPVLDVANCVAQVTPDRRMVPSGHHYTGFANSAIAQCTAPAVERALRTVRESGPHLR